MDQFSLAQLEEPVAPIIQHLDLPFDLNGHSLSIIRGDLIHPQVSGNKWYKLKHHLKLAIETGSPALVSFGGAYSNHIHALAAAGNAMNLPTIGVIRGAWRKTLTPTLEDAKHWGMKLVFVDNQSYRKRYQPEWIKEQLPHWWAQANDGQPHMEGADVIERIMVVPEGGSSRLGVKGVMDWATKVYASLTEPTSIVMAVGSGGTLAGFASVNSSHQLVGIPVVRSSGLSSDILGLLHRPAKQEEWSLGDPGTTWTLEAGFEFGGYGRWNNELLACIQAIEQVGLELDPVYTGKAFFALVKLAQQNAFQNRQLAFIHTGGLQGRRGLLK